MGHKAVFLDRDGTINEEVGYLNQVSRFRLLPRSAEAIRLLNQAGIKVVVITNQSGVARGYFPESLVHQVHERMVDELKEQGAHVDGIYYCPHHPEIGEPPYRQRCRCRKPETGLVEEAVKDLEIDCLRSYAIGDKRVDIEFGRKIGARAILVLTGHGREERDRLGDDQAFSPDFVAEDLYEAVQWVLSREGHSGRNR
ncbi:MAG: D-glycero-beta-D-manno-heptose 1,7-bisphosphate 7-phosphatase [Desulfobacterota bacterium]|nr:D-glycero-beta-D-manno-heptose 1,7-bisphosphate 7-phosphatase [Thermodesulfobacteriota bacterium]